MFNPAFSSSVLPWAIPSVSHQSVGVTLIVLLIILFYLDLTCSYSYPYAFYCACYYVLF